MTKQEGPPQPNNNNDDRRRRQSLGHAFYRLILTLHVFLFTPMWAMALSCFVFYWCGLAAHNHPIVRAFCWYIYLPLCLLEPADGRRYRWGLYSHAWTNRLRSLPCFRWVAWYFPVRLVKTVELPVVDDRPFIFAYHPHGVIGMGCCTALQTNACGFDRLFPSVPRRLGVTLSVCFWTPLYREWMLWMGLVHAERRTLLYHLQSGTSLILVPGGAREALLAAPGTSRLIRRRGFLRLAKDAQAYVVPCYGFGENDAFRTIQFQPGTVIRRVQNWLLSYGSVAFPLLASPFCQPHPIDVIIGAPLDAAAFDSLDALEMAYWRALEQLYNEHRNAYHDYVNVPLHYDE
jgi:hypothetical protein